MMRFLNLMRLGNVQQTSEASGLRGYPFAVPRTYRAECNESMAVNALALLSCVPGIRNATVRPSNDNVKH
jgi:hypothetical protein